MRKFIYMVILALGWSAGTLYAQQPHLKWNPSGKKLERLNGKLAQLNERLNNRNSAITQKLREAYPDGYDSLIQALYSPLEGEKQKGLNSGVGELTSDVSRLQQAMTFARGQEGTNELFKKLNLAKGEMQLLSSQQRFLERLPDSGVDLDALGIKDQVSQGQKELLAYNKLLEQYKASFDDLGSSLEQYVLKNPEVAAFKSEYEGLKELEKNQPMLRSDTAGLQTKALVREAMGKQLGLDPSEVTGFVNEKIAEANQSLDKLKKKYASVKDAGNISKTEKNPLATLPLKYRLVYQGNFSVNKGSLTSADFQLSLGYRLTPRMTFGAGASQRTSLGSGWESVDLKHQGWGYRFYYDYAINRAFFVQAAFERLHAQPLSNGPEAPSFSQWQDGGLIGIGRNFSLGTHSQGSLLIMYNLMDQQNSQFSNPWVLRFGFNFNKKNQ